MHGVAFILTVNVFIAHQFHSIEAKFLSVIQTFGKFLYNAADFVIDAVNRRVWNLRNFQFLLKFPSVPIVILNGGGL